MPAATIFSHVQRSRCARPVSTVTVFIAGLHVKMHQESSQAIRATFSRTWPSRPLSACCLQCRLSSSPLMDPVCNQRFFHADKSALLSCKLIKIIPIQSKIIPGTEHLFPRQLLLIRTGRTAERIAEDNAASFTGRRPDSNFSRSGIRSIFFTSHTLLKHSVFIPLSVIFNVM